MKIFIIIIFYSITLFAHHTAGGGDSSLPTNARFIDPFTGKREKPANYAVFSMDLQKAERQNRNVYTSSIFGEMVFDKGQFALNASGSYLYYDQKDRKDAGRIGKPFIGMKYLPFFDLQKNYFFVLETRLGFPAGPDTDKFAGGNYYLGVGNFTLGYKFYSFALVGKISGQFPLSKLSPSNETGNDGIPYYLRTNTISTNVEEIQLKKAGIYSIYLTYFLNPSISFLTGFLYRTPYYGVEKETSTADRVPNIFREASIGGTYNFSEKYFLSLVYRHPLDRGREWRPYEAGYTLALTMEF
ncbi:MAG: hypothetical protein SFU98_13645 [Leptospiraceae bacterium]|nr:hypothetical protein [Leptospiraceae bacterium]